MMSMDSSPESFKPTPSSFPLKKAFEGKKVFVTGHTGFKGSWLCEWLLFLGAEVTGFSLEPADTPALFDQLKLRNRLRHLTGDVQDAAAVKNAMIECKPDYVFHLAAQPLVRLSYQEPVETFSVNVMGTVHVMEALRSLKNSCSAVMITTDKCYENREWLHAYREEDPLGGYDPYSSSKAAAEISISAFRRSFFHPSRKDPVRLASARAGNVIGGGDWAQDRIVPDCFRALASQQAIPIRNKIATRPWQHVLEPLSGYLWLAACMAEADDSEMLQGAFNFGPQLGSNRTVAELVQEILRYTPGSSEDRSDPHAPHEAGKLNLTIDKAFHLLRWKPVWNFEETVAVTAGWYLAAAKGDPGELTNADLKTYIRDAARAGLEWAGIGEQ